MGGIKNLPNKFNEKTLSLFVNIFNGKKQLL